MHFLFSSVSFQFSKALVDVWYSKCYFSKSIYAIFTLLTNATSFFVVKLVSLKVMLGGSLMEHLLFHQSVVMMSSQGAIYS